MIEILIDKYYPKHRKVRSILLCHSNLVRDKSLLIAQNHPELSANVHLLNDGAMVHDIGIVFTNAPGIDCFGDAPYICHGILGRKVLEENGLEHLSLFAERHTGAGLSLHEIKQQELPLPARDMVPVSIEEQIVCFADKFFSKDADMEREKSLSQVRRELARHGIEQVKRFDRWCEIFL